VFGYGLLFITLQGMQLFIINPKSNNHVTLEAIEHAQEFRLNMIIVPPLRHNLMQPRP
jgi:hypothetical protein